MKIISSTITLLFSLLLFGCFKAKQKPSVVFTYSPQNPVVGQTVEFTNSSQNADTYFWEFGDYGWNTSMEKNPSHKYDKPGIYTVKLKASNLQNESSDYELKIQVNDVIPSNGPGTVSGSVNPPDVVQKVTLDAISGSKQYTAIPQPNGSFQYQSVDPGSYKVNITSKTTLYKAPTSTTVNILSGIHTEIPEIYMTYDNTAQTGIINFTIDGAQQTIYYNSLFLDYLSSTFHLSGTTPNTPYYFFDLKLFNVTGPGTINFSNSSSYIALMYYPSAGNPSGHWRTQNGGNGSVTISIFNQATRTATGSFTATLAPQGATTETKNVIGFFTDVRY